MFSTQNTYPKLLRPTTFSGKNRFFLYAVLEAKVETAKGKSIIRQYENTYDAQKAYEKLEEHHLTSNTAMFATTKIMEYLTTVCINDGSWHGTLENFLINWQ
jgi:hypothetical protein